MNWLEKSMKTSNGVVVHFRITDHVWFAEYEIAGISTQHKSVVDNTVENNFKQALSLVEGIFEQHLEEIE